MTDFVETPKGFCRVSPLNSEFTLCGDAFDLGTHEPGYEWKPTNARIVTCPDCAKVIRGVQGIRTRISRHD